MLLQHSWQITLNTIIVEEVNAAGVRIHVHVHVPLSERLTKGDKDSQQ